jgi:hypothetical protein
VFTARYALSAYIKQIHFVFKGLLEFLSILKQLGSWCRPFLDVNVMNVTSGGTFVKIVKVHDRFLYLHVFRGVPNA